LAAIGDQNSFEHGAIYLQPKGGVQPGGPAVEGTFSQFRRTAKLNGGNGLCAPILLQGEI
ncbi:hypothetical protein, partial [Bradyrhizobium sp.]|uniref:hypothetical protein n=1 Tax=Bradyrhizobium sp. TaxID=376 RepID=UPI002733409A